jgi:alpha-L-rhamnosidase
MSDWQSRSKWTATASLANTSNLLSCISAIINKTENIDYYRNLSKNVCIAYLERLTDGNGKLKNEFQTGYVLPIYYKMFNGDALKNACDSLVNLIKKNDYCIGTGFPGTPYILFALCDNGYQDEAYKMLLNTKCPSWLYEVKVGGTTIWERWDGLNENGECEISDDGTGGMISFNHFASGAVGDFLYKRLLGINPSSPGYETIEIKPVLNENIIFAKGSTITPYGKVSSDWKIENNEFIIEIVIPVGATCKLTMPSGDVHNVKSGKYRFSEKINIRSLYENK